MFAGQAQANFGAPPQQPLQQQSSIQPSMFANQSKFGQNQFGFQQQSTLACAQNLTKTNFQSN
jgi:hypothetical protein